MHPCISPTSTGSRVCWPRSATPTACWARGRCAGRCVSNRGRVVALNLGAGTIQHREAVGEHARALGVRGFMFERTAPVGGGALTGPAQYRHAATQRATHAQLAAALATVTAEEGVGPCPSALPTVLLDDWAYAGRMARLGASHAASGVVAVGILPPGVARIVAFPDGRIRSSSGGGAGGSGLTRTPTWATVPDWAWADGNAVDG
jgi:hypothetical protein